MGKPVEVIISARDAFTGVFRRFKSESAGAFRSVLGFPKSLVALTAGVSLGAFFKKALGEADQAAASLDRLRLAVGNAGADFDRFQPKITAALAELQKSTRFKDDQLTGGLEELITMTGDVAGSIDAMSLVTDIAVGKKIELSAAAEMVGKVMNGETAFLKKQGIEVKANQNAMDVLSQKYRGFAERDGKSFGGMVARISNAWDTFAEKVGTAILAGDGASDMATGLAGALAKAAAWIEINSDWITTIVDGAARLAGFLGTALVGALKLIVTGFAGFNLAIETTVFLFAQLYEAGKVAIGGLSQVIGEWLERSSGFFKIFGIDVDKTAEKLANFGMKLKNAGLSNQRRNRETLSDSAQRVRNLFADSGDAGEGSGATAGSRRGTPRPKLTEAQIKAIRDLNRAHKELLATEVEGKTKTQQFAEKIADWVAKAKESKMSAEQLAAMTAALNVQLEKIAAGEAAEALRELDNALLEASGDPIKQLTAKLNDELKKMQDQVKEITDPGKKAEGQAKVEALTAAHQKQIAVLKEVEASKRRLKDLDRELAEHPMEFMDMEELDKVGDLFQAEIRQIEEALKDPSLTEAQRDALYGQLDIARGKLDEWGEAVADKIDQTVEGWELLSDATTRWRENLAKGIEGAVELGRSIIAAAQAMGTMSDSTAAQLQNVLTAVSSVQKALAAMQAAREAGGSLLTGDFLGAMGGGIAALAALGRGLFAENPQDKARRDELARSTKAAADALDRLARTAGDLATLQQSGTTTAGVSRAIGEMFTTTPGKGLANLQILKNFERLDATLAKFGASRSDIDALLKHFEIAESLSTNYNTALVQLEALKRAIDSADLKAFSDTFTGQLEALHRGFELFGTTDAKDQFAKLIDLLTNAEHGAPALFKGLEGLDLSSAAGIADAKARIQELFQRALAGDLSAEELGGLNLQQFLDALRELMGMANAAGEAIGQGASALERLSDALRDIDTAAEILGTSGADVLKQKVAEFALVFPELAGILEGLDLSKAEDLETLKDRLRDLFLAFQSGAIELPDGTNLDALAQAILTLLGAAGTAASGITSAADQIAAAVDKLNTDWEIFGTSETDQATQTAGAHGLDLGQFDLSTKAGRDAAIAHLQDLYKTSRADPALVTAILATIRAIRKIPNSEPAGDSIGAGAGGGAGSAGVTSASASGIVNMTLVQADKLVGLVATEVGLIGDVLGTLGRIETALGLRLPTSAMSGFRVEAGGNLNFDISLTQHFYGPVGAFSREAADEMGSAALRMINAGLNRGRDLASQGRGDVAR